MRGTGIKIPALSPHAEYCILPTYFRFSIDTNSRFGAPT